MLKLMKYEIRRRLQIILIVLAVMAFIEGLILFGLYRGGPWLLTSFILTILMAIGVYLFILFDSIRTYYIDLNRNEGYMLFLTPNSGYRIIGSKALVSFLELVFFVLILVSFLLINFFTAKNLLINSSMEAKEMYDAITQAFQIFTPSVGHIFLLSLTTVLQWFSIIMMATLAITLTKTILSNTRLSWLISLGFFIAIYTGLQFLDMGIISIFGFINDMSNLANTAVITENDFPTISGIIFKYVTIMTVVYSAYISIFYLISGRLVSKRINI